MPYDAPAGPEGRPAASIKYALPAGSVGYKLLQKAGWQEGTGLGAAEQGVREPIQPVAQSGLRGLGYASKPPAAATRGTQRQQQQQGKGEGASGAAAAGAAGGQQQQGKQQQQQQRALPEDPLAKESTEAKVKRVRQVMQAEADAKAGKAIQRYIYSAFRDQTGEPTAADANPLVRRNHKLSATNPLL